MRDDDHPTAAVEALARGAGTPESNREAVRHLLAGCGACGALLRLGTDGQGAASYDQVFARLECRAAGLALAVAEEREDAADRLRELLALPRAHQRLWLANAARARSRALCEALVERSRELRHRQAGEMLRLAELAVVVAERLGEEDVSARIGAHAELGNAWRIVGDHDAADQELGRATKLYLTGGADPLQWAEVLSLLASLRTYQDRCSEARAHLRKAIRVYASFGDDEGVTRLLVKLALTLGHEGRPLDGVAVVMEALNRMVGGPPSPLRLLAVKNLAYLWFVAGEIDEAGEILDAARPAFDRQRGHAGDLDRLRFEWLGASIDLERDRPWAAAITLTRLRKEFAAQSLPYEVALVGLDLAYAYAVLERSEELRRSATEALDLLTRLAVAPEAIAAGALLASGERAEVRKAVAILATAIKSARKAAALRDARVN